MSKVNVDIDATKDAETIIAQLMKPISEKISQISDKLEALESSVEEAEVSEEKKCDCGKEECPDCKKEEKKDEEKDDKKEEKKECPFPCEKKDGEEKDDKKEEKKEKVSEDTEGNEAELEEVSTAEMVIEEIPAEKVEESEATFDEIAKSIIDEVMESLESKGYFQVDEGLEVSEISEEEIQKLVNDVVESLRTILDTADDSVEESNDATESFKSLVLGKIAEAWAQKDPKETVSERSDLPKPALNTTAPSGIGSGAWANEDPKETVTTKSSIADGKNPKKTELENKLESEIHAQEKKDAAAVNAGIEGGAKVSAHESVSEADEDGQAPVAQSASEFTQQVTDYKALYEALKDEFDKCNQVIDELLESIEDFGKRHREVVQEAETSKKEAISLKEQLEVADKSLNSYKLQEQFNITVDKANELLSSKDYLTVVEELKAAEAQQIEDEAQATADAVSESLSEANVQQAPASTRRKAHSAFSATISESKDEEVSESVETRPRRRAYSAF